MSKKVSLRAINFFNDEDFDPNSDEHKTSKNKVETSSDDINRYLTDQYKIKGKASRVEMSPVVSKRIKKRKFNNPVQPTSSGAPPHHGSFPNIRKVGVAVKVIKLAAREKWQDDAEKIIFVDCHTAWYKVKYRKILRVNRRKVVFTTSTAKRASYTQLMRKHRSKKRSGRNKVPRGNPGYMKIFR